MIDRDDDLPCRQMARQAMHAVLSDDHSYERGLAALVDLIDCIVGEKGEDGLREFTVALSLALAKALEHIAADQGLAAVDLADVWFAE